jgi:hypothetical protein
MDGLTVRQKHNTQEAILHLWHLHPAANSAISLDGFAKRLPDGLFNPLLSDESPIGPATDCLKVACDFHLANVADSPFVRSFCRITFAMSGARQRMRQPRWHRVRLDRGVRRNRHANLVRGV